jgi:hypothetical protein
LHLCHPIRMRKLPKRCKRNTVPGMGYPLKGSPCPLFCPENAMIVTATDGEQHAQSIPVLAAAHENHGEEPAYTQALFLDRATEDHLVCPSMSFNTRQRWRLHPMGHAGDECDAASPAAKLSQSGAQLLTVCFDWLLIVVRKVSGHIGSCGPSCRGSERFQTILALGARILGFPHNSASQPLHKGRVAATVAVAGAGLATPAPERAPASPTGVAAEPGLHGSHPRGCSSSQVPLCPHQGCGAPAAARPPPNSGQSPLPAALCGLFSCGGCCAGLLRGAVLRCGMAAAWPTRRSHFQPRAEAGYLITSPHRCQRPRSSPQASPFATADVCDTAADQPAGRRSCLQSR